MDNTVKLPWRLRWLYSTDHPGNTLLQACLKHNIEDVQYLLDKVGVKPWYVDIDRLLERARHKFRWDHFAEAEAYLAVIGMLINATAKTGFPIVYPLENFNEYELAHLNLTDRALAEGAKAALNT